MSETDITLYAIVALLPLSAGMVVVQVNPYHALVIRGILGAIAALVYALLGAADVALTEALVGTMLAITLYAVAVRSSLLMRLGIVQPSAQPLPQLQPSRRLETPQPEAAPPATITTLEPETQAAVPIAPSPTPLAFSLESYLEPSLESLLVNLRRALDKRHLRLELVPYPDAQALQQALQQKEVHAICTRSRSVAGGESDPETAPPTVTPPAYYTQIRVRRLYEILQAELPEPAVLTYAPVPNREEP
ncbi:DUF4040 domain-containing protein [Trichothermofontia sp.]